MSKSCKTLKDINGASFEHNMMETLSLNEDCEEMAAIKKPWKYGILLVISSRDFLS